MTMRIVRLDSHRERNEGLRIGTVRRPPGGVRKKDYASKNIYESLVIFLSLEKKIR